MIKTEDFNTSTQETDTTVAMTTQPLIKREPLEEDLPSTAAIYSTADVNTESDMLRGEIQQLRSDNQQLKMENQELKSQLQPALICSSGETQPSSAPLTGFRGVEVCGESTVVVTIDQWSFTWKGYGLTMHIPEGCLPAGMEQCTINIKASLAGQYEFPENSHLVSAVFWLCCESRCKFIVPVSLEIQHCARPENVSKLSFVKALCSQESLPYTFRQQLGGPFTSSSSYGILELESFSGAGVIQEGSEDREYIARLFYQNETIYSYDINLVVTWNTEAYLTVVKQEYKEALPGPDQPVDFELDQIKFDIPEDGISLRGGWRITPLTAPVVTKKHVDNYQPGKRIPNCELSADLKMIPLKLKWFHCATESSCWEQRSHTICLPSNHHCRVSDICMVWHITLHHPLSLWLPRGLSHLLQLQVSLLRRFGQQSLSYTLVLHLCFKVNHKEVKIHLFKSIQHIINLCLVPVPYMGTQSALQVNQVDYNHCQSYLKGLGL